MNIIVPTECLYNFNEHIVVAGTGTADNSRTVTFIETTYFTIRDTGIGIFSIILGSNRFLDITEQFVVIRFNQINIGDGFL